MAHEAEAGDFVYFDPPYVPLNATASFTSYTKEGFDAAMQERLRETCDRLHERGVLFMLSNSYTPYVLDLYRHSEYRIREVKAARPINSKGEGRGKISEVLVTNYEVPRG